MKAMIFAAGIGSRLKPFTDTKPKALLPVLGKPLLQHNMERLIQFGVTDFVINVHHFAEQIIRFLNEHDNFGVNIHISDETDLLLETGGGLEKARYLLSDSEPVVVQNSDIITDINFEQLVQFHKNKNALATLAVRNRESLRYLRFNEQNLLCGWENTKTGEELVARNDNHYEKLAFSGVHVISQELLGQLNKGGAYGIINLYLNLAKQNNIVGYMHDKDYWFDVGTPEKLSAVNAFLGEKE